MRTEQAGLPASHKTYSREDTVNLLITSEPAKMSSSSAMVISLYNCTSIISRCLRTDMTLTLLAIVKHLSLNMPFESLFLSIIILSWSATRPGGPENIYKPLAHGGKGSPALWSPSLSSRSLLSLFFDNVFPFRSFHIYPRALCLHILCTGSRERASAKAGSHTSWKAWR